MWRLGLLAAVGCGFRGPAGSVAPGDDAMSIDAALDGALDAPIADAGSPDAAADAPADAAVTTTSSFLIEAENYTQINAQPANSFAVAKDVAGYRGTGFMHCGPQTGGDCTMPLSSCSSLSYDLPNATAGNYYVHLRMFAVDSSDDSIYVTIDGSSLNELDPPRGAWSWITTGQPYAFGAGTHTLTLYRRECGARIDQVMVSMAMAPPP